MNEGWVYNPRLDFHPRAPYTHVANPGSPPDSTVRGSPVPRGWASVAFQLR